MKNNVKDNDVVKYKVIIGVFSCVAFNILNAFWTFTDNHIIMTVNTEILAQKTTVKQI
jgi:hypothetical protein